MSTRPTAETIVYTIIQLLDADKDWDFNLLCQDAIAGKRERLRQKAKNKRKYEADKKERLEAKMAECRSIIEFL